MWNVFEVGDKFRNILKGYDGRPLRFTEKSYADRMAHELNESTGSVRYFVVEENG